VDIESTIKTILIDDLFVNIPRAEISLDDGLRDRLGLDSLGFSELRAQCERAFGVKISNEEYNPKNFASIRALTRLISELRASPPAQE
jgi:acyl carrier protein